MILNNVKVVNVRDIAAHAWSDIRRFHNQEYVSSILMKQHSLGTSEKGNANKQARQIRYCLNQAREYAQAADAVSLATKPTLAYYSIMSFALAEVLFKQSGDSSLDRAREHHNHHGLRFVRKQNGLDAGSLNLAAENLFAEPTLGPIGRFGTFELWHRSAREMPISGELKSSDEGSVNLTSYRLLLGARDERLGLIPERGVSLLEALKHLPGLYGVLSNFGVNSDMVRGVVQAEKHGTKPTVYNVIVHPGIKQDIDRFLDAVIFHPSAVNQVDYHEGKAGGGVITWKLNESYQVEAAFPHSSMWKRDEVRFWYGVRPLNEFGYFYVALYIAGNYARYFPDKWIAAVEQCAPIALCIEELLNLASWRVPLLAASELTGIYKIPE